MSTNNKRREANNSVQYSSHLGDLNTTTINPKIPKINIFTGSERDNSITTDDTSKYFSASINFNKINKEKKHKVLESFNLVSANKPKTSKRGMGRTIHPSMKNSPRFSTGFNFDRSIMMNRLPFAQRDKVPKSFIYKMGNYKYNNNFKNVKKFNFNQRRTATNSPNFNNVTLSPSFNVTMRQKKNWVGEEKQYRGYENHNNICIPNTALHNQRAKPRLNSSLDQKISSNRKIKQNLVFNNNFMSPKSMKVSP